MMRPSGPALTESLMACSACFSRLRHRAAADVVFGVGVGVVALDVLDVLLDQVEAAPGGRVVGVDHQPLAERRGDRRVGADHLAAQELKIQFALGIHLPASISSVSFVWPHPARPWAGDAPAHAPERFIVTAFTRLWTQRPSVETGARLPEPKPAPLEHEH
jgi:hypothetical protein